MGVAVEIQLAASPDDRFFFGGKEYWEARALFPFGLPESEEWLSWV